MRGRQGTATLRAAESANEPEASPTVNLRAVIGGFPPSLGQHGSAAGWWAAGGQPVAVQARYVHGTCLSHRYCCTVPGTLYFTFFFSFFLFFPPLLLATSKEAPFPSRQSMAGQLRHELDN